MGQYIEVLFCLSTWGDKEIWQFIVGVAARLEYLAVAVLWSHSGKRRPWVEFENRLTLGKATVQLAQKGLLSADTVARLCAIADLRNRVVHRSAMYGVPMVAVYKGTNVFRDDDALAELVEDSDRTVKDMAKWLEDNEPSISRC